MRGTYDSMGNRLPPPQPSNGARRSKSSNNLSKWHPFLPNNKGDVHYHSSSNKFWNNFMLEGLTMCAAKILSKNSNDWQHCKYVYHSLSKWGPSTWCFSCMDSLCLHEVPYWSLQGFFTLVVGVPYCIVFQGFHITYCKQPESLVAWGAILLPNGVGIDRMFWLSAVSGLRERESLAMSNVGKGGAYVLVSKLCCEWIEMAKTKEKHQEHNCFH